MHAKEKVVALFAILTLTLVVPAFASSTTYTNTDQTVIQTQWRAAWSPFGTLTGTIDDSGPYYTYTATGNSLHETFTYSPSVTDVSGASHIYAFVAGTYHLNSGVVSYTSPYSGLTIYEVWSGSISFGGAVISLSNLGVTTGQLNQWGFVYYPGEIPPSFYPNAVAMGSGYWLVGFSTYTYGGTGAPAVSDFFALALSPPHLP